MHPNPEMFHTDNVGSDTFFMLCSGWRKMSSILEIERASKWDDTIEGLEAQIAPQISPTLQALK